MQERSTASVDNAAAEIAERLRDHKWFVATATTPADTVVIILKSRKAGRPKELNPFLPDWQGHKVSIHAVDDLFP